MSKYTEKIDYMADLRKSKGFKNEAADFLLFPPTIIAAIMGAGGLAAYLKNGHLGPVVHNPAPIEKSKGHPGQPTHPVEVGTGKIGGSTITQRHLGKHNKAPVHGVSPDGPMVEEFGPNQSENGPFPTKNGNFQVLHSGQLAQGLDTAVAVKKVGDKIVTTEGP